MCHGYKLDILNWCYHHGASSINKNEQLYRQYIIWVKFFGIIKFNRQQTPKDNRFDLFAKPITYLVT